MSIGNLQNLLPEKNTGYFRREAKKKRINLDWQRRALKAWTPSSFSTLPGRFSRPRPDWILFPFLTHDYVLGYIQASASWTLESMGVPAGFSACSGAGVCIWSCVVFRFRCQEDLCLGLPVQWLEAMLRLESAASRIECRFGGRIPPDRYRLD
jgi:hypothetical protein